jgi:hypothetical protein
VQLAVQPAVQLATGEKSFLSFNLGRRSIGTALNSEFPFAKNRASRFWPILPKGSGNIPRYFYTIFSEIVPKIIEKWIF